MTSEAQLLAIEEIRRLKARYFRCMDTRDWNSYGRTFSKRGSLEVQSLRGGEMAISRREVGIDAIVRWVSGVLDGAITIHQGHMPEIEISTSEEASAIWAMEDRVIWPERSLHGWGHYHDTYVREEGCWLIATSCLTRLRVEISPATGLAAPLRPQMIDFGYGSGSTAPPAAPV